MNVIETPLPGVLVIEPRVFSDQRGFFLETYHRQRYTASGIDEVFVQDNHSRSAHGTLRGLHFQLKSPQGKLVRVSAGEVFDVAVDIRRGSPYFGQWFGEYLSSENNKQMYVPPGFAHGFCVLSEMADFMYKCSDFYDPTDEQGVAWDDPALAIDWPIDQPILSQKDAALPNMSELMDCLPRFAMSQV
ncbi:dTDP-4-dehydrorhamnose 3,5-epimerase [Acaryochloris sp. CCMEE 5410]|uniref:dTDP-4-dehydrorhamnose 3,5-epimerase n=1 Tax=Acaryochloris sp. CCMEE 5410 TaxID=310037 RepID=UPI000248500D|nr:dTDP-4-dehydrorhamnose 3,5-epimerase [Acaryochloris sp. CCMEE 5410]KAI9130485.1 dTDP-4-dehydrorhamnose 3,5-epimerase [Acaryochloris sp. CCMEE 5410]